MGKHDDLALAALMGAAADVGAGFGVADYSPDNAFEQATADFGHFGLSAFDPSANIGFGFGADPAPVLPPLGGSQAALGQALAQIPKPTNAAEVQQVWNAHWSKQIGDAARMQLLEPNANSNVKIQRYEFSLSATLTLGSASAISTNRNPSARIRPQRTFTNVPTVGFVTLTTVQIANVNVMLGGVSDAFTYSAQAQGSMLDLPTLDPAYQMTVTGNYSGLAPSPFTTGSFTFVFTVQGPANLAGSTAY